MEVISSKATMALVAAVFVVIAAVFPAVSAAGADISVPAPAPSTSDGHSIDQGIAYLLMLLALALTYIIH